MLELLLKTQSNVGMYPMLNGKLLEKFFLRQDLIPAMLHLLTVELYQYRNLEIEMRI